MPPIPEMPEIRWWCRKCQGFVMLDVAEVRSLHTPHWDQIVGVRTDILIDSMKRLVTELGLTHRLERPGKP